MANNGKIGSTLFAVRTGTELAVFVSHGALHAAELAGDLGALFALNHASAAHVADRPLTVIALVAAHDAERFAAFTASLGAIDANKGDTRAEIFAFAEHNLVVRRVQAYVLTVP